MLTPAYALDLTVSPAEIVNGVYYVVKGDTIYVKLKGGQNQVLTITANYKFRISATGGKYYYKLENFPLPESIDRLKIKAYPVKVLNVSSAVLWFIPVKLTAWATNDVAVISLKNIPKGEYTIEIYGKTSRNTVYVDITSTFRISLDENGLYTITYDTSKLPPGDLTVSVAGETVRARVVSSASEIPTVTPTVTTTIPVIPTTTSPTEIPTEIPTETTTTTTTTTTVTTTWSEIVTTVTSKNETKININMTNPATTTAVTTTTTTTVTTVTTLATVTTLENQTTETETTVSSQPIIVPGFELVPAIIGILLVFVSRRVK